MDMILGKATNKDYFSLGQTVIHRGTCRDFIILDIRKDGDLVLSDGRTDSPDNYCTITHAVHTLQAMLENIKLINRTDMSMVLQYHKERADRLERELLK